MPGDPELEAMNAIVNLTADLDPDGRRRVAAWFADREGVVPSTTAAPTNQVGVPARGGTIKEFVRAKRPANDVDRVAALAYHVTTEGGSDGVATKDLSKARIEAAIPAFNVSRAVSHAQRAGYLTSGTRKGSYQLTAAGESLVEAMPDQEMMRAIRAEANKGRRRAATSARRSASSEKK